MQYLIVRFPHFQKQKKIWIIDGRQLYSYQNCFIFLCINVWMHAAHWIEWLVDMSFTNCFEWTASSTGNDRHLVRSFFDVAWDDDISNVKERLHAGVLVDSVNEFCQMAIKHLYLKWDSRLCELQTMGLYEHGIAGFESRRLLQVYTSTATKNDFFSARISSVNMKDLQWKTEVWRTVV